MKILHRTVIGLFAAAALWAGLVPRADAAFVLTINPDVNGNVVAYGSGTLNTSALSMSVFGGPFQSALFPNYVFGASILTGGFSSNALQSNGILSGPFSYGTGNNTRVIHATSGSGDIVGLSALSLVVPENYISGTPLANQALWAGQSIDSLGLTPGTYNYTWSSGASADSYSIEISRTVVPEPGVLSLFAVGGMALLRRRRRGQPRVERRHAQPPDSSGNKSRMVSMSYCAENFTKDRGA